MLNFDTNIKIRTNKHTRLNLKNNTTHTIFTNRDKTQSNGAEKKKTDNKSTFYLNKFGNTKNCQTAKPLQMALSPPYDSLYTFFPPAALFSLLLVRLFSFFIMVSPFYK